MVGASFVQETESPSPWSSRPAASRGYCPITTSWGWRTTGFPPFLYSTIIARLTQVQQNRTLLTTASDEETGRESPPYPRRSKSPRYLAKALCKTLSIYSSKNVHRAASATSSDAKIARTWSSRRDKTRRRGRHFRFWPPNRTCLTVLQLIVWPYFFREIELVKIFGSPFPILLERWLTNRAGRGRFPCLPRKAHF